jgi:hypothetical protein
MKPTLRIKILLYLAKKLEKLPKGQKPAKWILATIWLIKLPIRIKESNFIHWITNIWFVFLSSKSRARVFRGLFYRELAVRYANKRSKISRVNKVCGGKRHYVITYDNDSLIVLNKIEMNALKAKRVLHKSYNCLDVFKNAYYVTA